MKVQLHPTNFDNFQVFSAQDDLKILSTNNIGMKGSDEGNFWVISPTKQGVICSSAAPESPTSTSLKKP